MYDAPAKRTGIFTKRNTDLGHFLANSQKGMGKNTPASINHIIGLYIALDPNVF